MQLYSAVRGQSSRDPRATCPWRRAEGAPDMEKRGASLFGSWFGRGEAHYYHRLSMQMGVTQELLLIWLGTPVRMGESCQVGLCVFVQGTLVLDLVLKENQKNSPSFPGVPPILPHSHVLGLSAKWRPRNMLSDFAIRHGPICVQARASKKLADNCS